jgi:hypothetical protein
MTTRTGGAPSCARAHAARFKGGTCAQARAANAALPRQQQGSACQLRTHAQTRLWLDDHGGELVAVAAVAQPNQVVAVPWERGVVVRRPRRGKDQAVYGRHEQPADGAHSSGQRTAAACWRSHACGSGAPLARAAALGGPRRRGAAGGAQRAAPMRVARAAASSTGVGRDAYDPLFFVGRRNARTHALSRSQQAQLCRAPRAARCWSFAAGEPGCAALAQLRAMTCDDEDADDLPACIATC